MKTTKLLLAFMILFIVGGCHSTEQKVLFPRTAMYNQDEDLGFSACLHNIQPDSPILARMIYVDSERTVRKELIDLYRVGGSFDPEQQCRYFNFRIKRPVYAEDVLSIELTYAQE